MVTITTHRVTGIAAVVALRWLMTGAAQAVTPQEQLAAFSAAFRLLWGGVGTRYARFRSFVRGPRAVSKYLSSLLRGRPEHHIGHNPAGAVAIVALMVLTGVTVLSDWATYTEWGGAGVGDWVGALAVLLLAGVLVFWWLQWRGMPTRAVSSVTAAAGAPAEKASSRSRQRAAGHR